MAHGSGSKRRLLAALGPLWRIRSLGLWSELLFWEIWLRFRAGREERARLLDPNRRVLPELDPVLARFPDRRVRVLEVGAGPISVFGYVHPDKQIELVPTDLLADRYRRMLTRLGVEPPVRTVQADAERLREVFAADSFDLVFAANCLDHMEHPLAAIEQMVEVVRPGGWIVLSHRADEGARQGYSGLHRWNVGESGGRLILWTPSERIDVSARLAGPCEVRATTTDAQVRVEIGKSSRSLTRNARA